MIDAGGLALMPSIIDIDTYYDAQVAWDPTLSPSPSLGVTTQVIGNCGFGIVPSPPPLRDLIMRNLAVVEGMDPRRAARRHQMGIPVLLPSLLARPSGAVLLTPIWRSLSGIRPCAPP